MVTLQLEPVLQVNTTAPDVFCGDIPIWVCYFLYIYVNPSLWGKSCTHAIIDLLIVHNIKNIELNIELKKHQLLFNF